jgi:hypothetical protein
MCRYSDGLPARRLGFNSRQGRFFSPQRPDRLYGPPSLLSSMCHHLVLRSRMVELYLHSPICLHGTMINSAHGQLFFYVSLPAHSGPRPSIQFRNHFSQAAKLTGRVISPSQSRYLNTGQQKHRINSYTHQTSMP